MKESNQILYTDFLIIDLPNKRYKPLHTFFIYFKIGTWKPLPKITSVAVAQINMSYSPSMSRGGVANTTENKHKAYCIFLRSKVKNVRVLTSELDNVKTEAKKIAEFLDKPLYDYCKN
ncbi:MAG: hypothetical protein ACPGSO_07045 [Vicingaceae bacterium]